MRVQRMSRSRRRAVGLAALCTAALLSSACQPPERPTTSGDTEPSAQVMSARAEEGAVIGAHRALIRALEEADMESVLALLDRRAGLLIFHPQLENRFDGYDEIRDGLGRMFARLQHVEWTEVHQAVRVEGSVAWLTSQVLVKSDELDSPFVGRGTEIWVRRDGDWRLAHGHWSQHAKLGG